MALEQIGLAAVLDDKNFQAGLKRYTSGIGQMTKITDSATSVLSGAFVAATGLAVAGIGAVVAASKIGLDATLQWAEGLDKLGDQFGMSGEVASGWQFLMNKVGLSIDEGAQGLNYFTKQLDDFGKASKSGQTQVTPFMTALQKLGVNAKDAQGKLKDFDTIMPEIMDQFEKLPSGVQASALAMDLFGARGGTKFLDFLRQGGKGLKDATAAAKALGLELSTDEVNAAEEFGFAMNELNLGLLGVKNTIGRAVLPLAKQFVEWLNRHAIPPLVDLAKRYVPLFARALDALGDILGNLTSGRGLNALFRFYYLLEDIFGRDTAKKIYDIMTAVGAFKDSIIALAQRLQGAFKVGGLGGLGGQIALELQKAWPAISAQLRTWAGQFWDWLTGPGGALEQAGAQLGKIGGAIQGWAQENGPKLFAGLQGLASDFWQWLWGPGGALERTGVQLEKIMYAMKIWIENNANMQPVWDALGGWIGLFWSWVTGRGGVLDTVATNMDKLSADLLAWAQDPKTARALEEIGAEIARTIIDGIGKLFTSDQARSDSAMSHLVNSLNQARINLAASLSAVGANVAVDFVNALVTRLGGPDLTEALRAGIYAWFNAAVQAFVLGNTQPLIQMLIDGILGKVTPAPAPAPYSPLPSNVSQFAHGGWVNRTGMALVHRGEYVIPARQTSNISNNNSRSVGTVTVNINGSTGMGASEIKKAVYAGIQEVLEAA